jgi:BMFP domain-containing protein YqiC
VEETSKGIYSELMENFDQQSNTQLKAEAKVEGLDARLVQLGSNATATNRGAREPQAKSDLQKL